MSAPIALATAAVARDVDEDLPPLLRAARDSGIEAVAVDWDDASTDWSTFERVVIRSTWDYTQRLEEFLAWTDHVASVSRLVNPASVVAWNCDKRYLAALGAAGLPVVPSWFVGPGDSASIPAGVPEGEIVVKPTVSAGSRDTARYRWAQREQAEAHVRRLVGGGRTAMVQPYEPTVDRDGETALLYFGGALSHAIRKGPLLRPDAAPTRALFAEEHITAVEPVPEQLAVGEQVLDALVALDPFAGSTPDYVRVDLVERADGGFAILELELIEPSIFTATAHGAAERFVDAVLR